MYDFTLSKDNKGKTLIFHIEKLTSVICNSEDDVLDLNISEVVKDIMNHPEGNDLCRRPSLYLPKISSNIFCAYVGNIGDMNMFSYDIMKNIGNERSIILLRIWLMKTYYNFKKIFQPVILNWYLHTNKRFILNNIIPLIHLYYVDMDFNRIFYYLGGVNSNEYSNLDRRIESNPIISAIVQSIIRSNDAYYLARIYNSDDEYILSVINVDNNIVNMDTLKIDIILEFINITFIGLLIDCESTIRNSGIRYFTYDLITIINKLMIIMQNITYYEKGSII